MTRKELYQIRADYIAENCPYKMIEYELFDYSILKNIMYIKRSAKGHSETFSDCIIALDTETSKTENDIFISPEWYEIKNRLSGLVFDCDSTYFNQRSAKEYYDLGIKFKKGAKNSIDSLYSDLVLEYPYLFDDCFNVYDEIENIAEYLGKNKPPEEILDNYIVAFTVSIRAFNQNIVTLFGHNPRQLTDCLYRIWENITADVIPIYIHNMAYDWVFIRQFMFEKFGTPSKQLNVKSHVPLFIKFENGLMLKDSYLLSQKSLEKWANDLDVEHKKAIGSWDYKKVRNQSDIFTTEELVYIEHDTLALCECIDKTMETLHRSIATIPYTATGIPRGDIEKIGKQFKAKDNFNKIVSEYDLYVTHESNVFHGGYTHANRFYIEQTIDDDIVECKDFTSSYPYVMLTEKYPSSAFLPIEGVETSDLIKKVDKYAFMFKITFINVRLKDRAYPMPPLQYSKCIKCIGELIDNGRILRADLIEIYLNEIDFKIIYDRYDADIMKISDCYFAKKDYLPWWFTDYIFSLFRDKCTLKGKDQQNYMISKGKLNSCFGMCVQKPISEIIEEDYHTGDYSISEDFDPEYEYRKYMKNWKKILPYSWGIWVTSYAFKNLFTLGAMCEEWIYSDTDSCYGINWNNEAVEAYNLDCLKKLKARGYGAVTFNGKDYILGQAVTEGDVDRYIEFRVLGAKRYCGRSKADGKLHITVAGVPKKGAECLKDDIENFTKGFIFKGEETGKLQHTYIYGDIREDKNGNILADSINLSKCDYKLDNAYSLDIEDILFRESEDLQVYAET